MLKIFTNKTATPQQIMTIDGKAVKIMPGESASVDLKDIYQEEFDRSDKFFSIKDDEPTPAVSSRSARVSVAKKEVEENEDGGNE